MNSTKAHLLHAAESLMVERGLSALTAGEIAKTAGVNKALVFYHWGELDGLVGAALEGYYARHAAALEVALSDAHDLERVVDVYFDFLVENQAFVRIVQEQVARHRPAHPSPHAPLIKAHLESLYASVAARLSLDPARGRELQLTFAAAAVNTFTYGSLLGGVDLSARRQHLKQLARALVSDF